MFVHWPDMRSPGRFHKGLPGNKTENFTAAAQEGHRVDTRGSQRLGRWEGSLERPPPRSGTRLGLHRCQPCLK